MTKQSRKGNDENVLTTETAEQLLHQVFDACGYEHNKVPLEALESYSNYRKEKYSFQRSVIIVTLTLFILLPFLFISATIYVAMRNEIKNTNPTYQVSVSGGIPVQKIVATIDGKNVPVLELSNHEYVLQPGINGKMDIQVLLINQQNTSAEITVEDVDSDPPVLVSTDFQDDGSMQLHLMDANSGISWNGIIVRDEDGDIYECETDAETGILTVPYPESVLTVTVPDMKGNVLTITLTPEEEAITDDDQEDNGEDDAEDGETEDDVLDDTDEDLTDESDEELVEDADAPTAQLKDTSKTEANVIP